jgi:hypothetical protein
MTPEDREHSYQEQCELRRAVLALCANPADEQAQLIVNRLGERYGLYAKVGGVSLEEAATADPLKDLAAVARGDLQAQRRLALRAWCEVVRADPETGELILNLECEDVGETMELALTFARLAATHGELQDNGALVNRLIVASLLMPQRQSELAPQAIAWAHWGADAGHEEAADCLNLLTENATPETVIAAKHYAERLNEYLPLGTSGVS